ncbi:MAG: hypothetical protein IJ890_05715 [Clostridia bacterium]|nr:hypothetical protein [Clostridia bacterium]
MNEEKIKIAKILNKLGYDISAKDIIVDLKSKSFYTYINEQRVGCYYDEDLKTVIMYGNIELAKYFIDGLVKLLRLK